MKRLLFFVVISLLFIGQASRVEASEGGKSHLQMANEDIAVIDAIAAIDDPDLRVVAIRQFLNEIKPILDHAVNSGFNKFAWKISKPGKEETWWVIYESKQHAVASAWLCKGNPPEDATILLTKGEKL